ncbi:MAG: hypothetical protein AAB425_04730, partial [Bdellovibrionota bacterium]
MKILVLNPQYDVAQDLTLHLKNRGATVLWVADPDTAWKVALLHAPSLSCVVVHREGPGTVNGGLQLLEKLKAHQELRSVALILTSTAWGPTDFVAHKKTAFAAHQYLGFPLVPEKVVDAMDQIFCESHLAPVAPKAAPPQLKASAP